MRAIFCCYQSSCRLGFMFALLLCTGCSSIGSQSPVLIPAATNAEKKIAAAPFTFTIHEDLNTGEAIHVVVAVKSHVPWNPDNIGLKLSALAEGEEIASKTMSIGKATNSHQPIPANEELSVPISVMATGITDYQVELLWGDDARSVITSEKTSDVELQNLEVVNADGYVVTGNIKNTSRAIVNSITLGIGFVRGTEGALYVPSIDQQKIPESEERMEIPSLSLAPGESRPIKLKVQRPKGSGPQTYSVSVRIIR